jgi:hypothetical protein
MGHGLTGKGKSLYPLHCEKLIMLFIRAEIQRVFFPPTYQTAERTRPLEPGNKRIWTALQIFVELRDETTMHIPFREASKVHILPHLRVPLTLFAGLAMGWFRRESEEISSEGASVIEHCGWRSFVNQLLDARCRRLRWVRVSV